MRSKILTALFLIATAATTRGQKMDRLTGIWLGTLHTGVDLRVVFHFSKSDSSVWTCSMDSPDQMSKGIPCKNVAWIGDSVVVESPAIGGKFQGHFINDSTITGEWSQGRKLALELKKVLQAPTLSRPQTPQPPFPYESRDVIYFTKDSAQRFGATLTIPMGKGPFPALVMITGSGAQDRDETILGHKSFAVIADYLTRRGVIVLRVDDRGVGQSTGSFATATSADFALDVENSLNYLKTIPQVDLKHLGLIGHSEGGMIAPMVASRRKDIDFIILLAGPGTKITTLMQDQNEAVLSSLGIKKEAAASYRNFFGVMEQAVITSPNDTIAIQKISLALSQWRDSTPKNYVFATTGIHNDSSAMAFVKSTVQVIYTPWFRYFLNFDPEVYLSKLHCKVLALNGEKDVQVLATPNLAGIEAALKKSRSKSYETHMMPQMNHLFQTCKLCTIQEYGKLEETFSPAALQQIDEWLKRVGILSSDPSK